ncbi:hypothetical protein CMsap09_07680 [Clavibacter michiganensis]|uniref:Uncharacterized protein n=1 Tax=Clavibacter michiganensis TaxID=28447 RepID=A0A251XTK8_9MICO|nr:hypothetical protein CMsap09_07680 [Clavibacter michiganensis]
MQERHGGGEGERQRGARGRIEGGGGGREQPGGDGETGPTRQPDRADPQQRAEREEDRRGDQGADAEVAERIRGSRPGEVVRPHRPDVEVEEDDADDAHRLRRPGQSSPCEDRGRGEGGDGHGAGDGRAHEEPVGDEGVDDVEHGGHGEQHDADAQHHDRHAQPAARGGRRGTRGGRHSGGRHSGGGLRRPGERRRRAGRIRRRCPARLGRHGSRRGDAGGCRRGDRTRGLGARRLRGARSAVSLRGACGRPVAHGAEQPRAVVDEPDDVRGHAEDLGGPGCPDVEAAPGADQGAERGEAGGAQVRAGEMLGAIRPGGSGTRCRAVVRIRPRAGSRVVRDHVRPLRSLGRIRASTRRSGRYRQPGPP